MLFKNRIEAGILLSNALSKYKSENTVIVAIPRGGVVVAFEVAKRLKVPLDLIIPRKLGAPGNPELAIGAIGPDGSLYLNEEIIRWLDVKDDYIEKEKRRQLEEIKRRTLRYKGSLKLPNLKGKNVIIIDDGVATGATMIAAAKTVRKLGAEKVVIAIPVAPPDTINRLKRESDEVICLSTPQPFFAIGQFYENFAQTSDEEVVKILKEAKKLI